MFWAERRFRKGRAVSEAMTPAVKEPNLQRIKTNCGPQRPLLDDSVVCRTAATIGLIGP